jgi:hypothetical protein
MRFRILPPMFFVLIAGQAFAAGRAPVTDINQAAVYSINELIRSDADVETARKLDSDVLIRGWFKWHDAFDQKPLERVIPQAHARGALFGGGITCSALYDGENGLTEEQVRDMATRGPAGEMVNAWNNRGVRHGTLSNPKYVEYLLSWCYKQIDAGVDCLFMDEHNAALMRNEGFDDYSNHDFRDYLARVYCKEQNWTASDPRWRQQFKIDLSDKAIAPNGTIQSFDYRGYLKANNLTADPHAARNPLAANWAAFRRDRDDIAWKKLTDGIRAYAASKGQRVFISGNGLTDYVDFQVLGVWGLWRVKDGKVDFAENQLHDWAALVRSGRALAGRKVPVVFFHDWGFQGFPWMKVTPAERTLWNRIRAAEIYAAGAYYAFPVHGPFGCDATRDGTLDEMAHQAAFYRRNKALYLDADLRSIDSVTAADPLLSVSLWTRNQSPAVIVHAINRNVTDLKLVQRQNVAIDLPADALPQSIRIVSPDWEGEKTGRTEKTPAGIRLIIPQLDTYAVAILEHPAIPKLNLAGDRIVPAKRWERPARNEFKVDRDGAVDAPQELNGILQGRLHSDMSNPPTFLINAEGPAKMSLMMQSVSTAGAKIECLIDGAIVTSVDLPDLDGKNDTSAKECERVIEIPIPPGRHRVSLRNSGGDWATIAWYRFSGALAD